MNIGDTLDWFNFASHVIAVLIGGMLVVLANELAERRRRISAYEEFQEHERAVYTGLFAVRNFIVEHLNTLEGNRASASDFVSLEVAQTNLNRLIDKSRPSGQAFLMVLFELSLCLDDLLAAVRLSLDDDEGKEFPIENKVDALVKSIEQFDIIAESSLDMISEEFIKELAEPRD